MEQAIGGSEDRRVAVRVGAGQIDQGVRCRVVPGEEARLIDVSPYGVLIETSRALAPGRSVRLQVAKSLNGYSDVHGRVIRCAVAALSPDGGPRFHAGIAVAGNHGPLRDIWLYERQQLTAE